MAAPAPRRLRVTNFERVSTDRQETERQRYDLADNAEEFNLDVVETVRLKVSGPKVNTKPDWQKMLEGVKSPDRDGINISALDRLFRPEDFAIIGEALEVFRTYKKVIVSTKERLIEPWTPRGWQTCMEAVLQAGKELAELKRRTAGGRRKAHANNKPMNTEPPYGMLYRDKYSKDADGKCQYFYEDPTPASNGAPRREIVEMVFTWRYVERWKIYQIVKRLNELGILSAGKKRKDGTWQYEPGLWSADTVKQLLRNRHYIGEHWEGGKRVDVACPRFIDNETFEGVQEMSLAEKEKADRKGRPSNEALLHEYLECDRCEKNMYFHRGHRHHDYRCHHVDRKLQKRTCDLPQVRASIIEPAVFFPVWRLLTQAELLLANARAYYDSLPARPALAALQAEQKEVEARIERMQRMVHLGTYDEEKGNSAILGDQKRIAEIKAEIKTVGVAELPEAHRVEAFCREIGDPLDVPSRFDTQRPVLEQLVDFQVRYDGEYVTITGKVPVPVESAAMGRKSGKRVNSHPTSTLYIPFFLKERVPEAPPRGSREQSLKGWETRRAAKEQRAA